MRGCDYSRRLLTGSEDTGNDDNQYSQVGAVPDKVLSASTPVRAVYLPGRLCLGRTRQSCIGLVCALCICAWRHLGTSK
jgi:hypothetical protein